MVVSVGITIHSLWVQNAILIATKMGYNTEKNRMIKTKEPYNSGRIIVAKPNLALSQIFSSVVRAICVMCLSLK